MESRTAIATEDAPAPAHTYSQGVRVGHFIQVSGQGPVDPHTNEYLHPGDISKQTIRALQNVEAVLKATGASFDNVIMLRVYLARREDFSLMNDAYGEFLESRLVGGVLPSRTTVVVDLPRDDTTALPQTADAFSVTIRTVSSTTWRKPPCTRKR